MIRQCQPRDSQRIYAIINEAARAYEGAIPDDCYPQPYMPMSELEEELKRVTFFGWEADGELVGIMGLEPIKDTTLIRHAYVLPRWQRQGISTKLLDYIKKLVKTPHLLVGTWAGATWAIKFYEKHGFELLEDKDELLKEYWDIPQRQVETSVVLGVEVG
jgi:GNAT superfamily N-acetyltransferase